MLPIIKNQSNWWKNRKIDWRSNYFVMHAHQQLIIDKLRTMNVGSVVEVGCGAGKNIFLIKKLLPKIQVGGTDINEDAIQTAKDIFNENGMIAEMLEVSPAHDLFLNDKSTDILLTDACLIYVNDIDRTIREFRRVTRQGIMFVELYNDDWKKRLLMRWNTGYRLHKYNSLLRKHGFYDVRIEKIPKALWPGNPWEEFGYLITAKL